MNANQYKKFEQYQRHIKNLKRLFPKLRRYDDAEALSILYRLEAKQSRAAVAYCNGDIKSGEYLTMSIQTQKKLLSLLGDSAPIEINGDPRGYALKLSDAWSKDKQIYRDLGGYGIIAPEF